MIGSIEPLVNRYCEYSSRGISGTEKRLNVSCEMKGGLIWLTATLNSSGIALAIDTNADGIDDGTISTSWKFLD